MGGSVSKRESDQKLDAAEAEKRQKKVSEPQPSVTWTADMAGEASAGAGEEDLVQTVFRWDHGGNQVYVVGAFNNWACKFPLHRSGNNFSYICPLPKKKHAYKFIVDGEWRFAPDQATVTDTAGNINNFIDLTTFSPDSEVVRSRNDTVLGKPFVVEDEENPVTKEPPTLPPHLRTAFLLNTDMPGELAHTLPKPQYVTLNHLYCTTIVDKLMVQAVSVRYKEKSVTAVFYSVMPQPQSVLLASQSPTGGSASTPADGDVTMARGQ